MNVFKAVFAHCYYSASTLHIIFNLYRISKCIVGEDLAGVVPEHTLMYNGSTAVEERFLIGIAPVHR